MLFYETTVQTTEKGNLALCSIQGQGRSEESAVIAVTDEGIPGRNIPAIRVQDGTRFNAENIHWDISQWSSDYSLILAENRTVIDINDNVFVRLHSRPDFNPPIYRQNTRAIINTDSTEYYNPAVYIRRSKFFQGMDAGINLFTNHGAYVEIHDTLMVASRGGVSMQLGQSVVDVIGSTIVGCNSPISLADFTNLGRMPVDEDEFCPVKSPSSFTSGYYGANNRINFHRTTFKGTFLTSEGAMRFWSDTLKTDSGQNTDNQRVDLQGSLCRGFLRRNTTGAVQVGHELCPPRAQLAESQNALEVTPPTSPPTAPPFTFPVTTAVTDSQLTEATTGLEDTETARTVGSPGLSAPCWILLPALWLMKMAL